MGEHDFFLPCRQQKARHHMVDGSSEIVLVILFEEVATWESNELAVGMRSREDTIVDCYLLSCHTPKVEYSFYW